jgi:arginyl-tRNA synthetase
MPEDPLMDDKYTVIGQDFGLRYLTQAEVEALIRKGEIAWRQEKDQEGYFLQTQDGRRVVPSPKSMRVFKERVEAGDFFVIRKDGSTEYLKPETLRDIEAYKKVRLYAEQILVFNVSGKLQAGYILTLKSQRQNLSILNQERNLIFIS